MVMMLVIKVKINHNCVVDDKCDYNFFLSYFSHDSHFKLINIKS